MKHLGLVMLLTAAPIASYELVKWAWANGHGEWVVGGALACIIAAGVLTRQERERRRGRWHRPRH